MTILKGPAGSLAVSIIDNLRLRINFQVKRWGSATGVFNVGAGYNTGATAPYANVMKIDVANLTADKWIALEHYQDLTGVTLATGRALACGIWATGGVTGKVSFADLVWEPVHVAPIAWQQSKSSGYTLNEQDVGTQVYISTGGVTVNALSCPIGSMITIINNSGSNQTLTQGGGTTLRLAGTATTGNRTIAAYGICNLMKIGASEWTASGAGVS